MFFAKVIIFFIPRYFSAIYLAKAIAGSVSSGCVSSCSFFFADLLMLRITPMYTQLMMVDVPPRLTSGSGCPVTGASPTATHMLNSACVTSSKARPMARKAGKLFSQRLAIRPVRNSSIIYSRATNSAPSIPISSIIIAYMKSEKACERKSRSTELPGPLPT